VLVDVNSHFQIDIDAVEQAITERTRAIVPVHYAGQACDLDELIALAKRHGLAVIEDGAHAAGASYRGRKIGTHGMAAAFSFYATKNMTTGEGGMITTADDQLAERIRLLSLHGMTRDAWKRYSEAGSWYYEVTESGFKCNMTDIQASLGIHQLRRLDGFVQRRREIANAYRSAFADLTQLQLPQERPDRDHIYHLFPVQVAADAGVSRDGFINELKKARIGTSVHFVPVHRHPFYRRTYGYSPGAFPEAERIYRGLVSLPLYPRMTDADVADVVAAVRGVLLDARDRKIAASTPAA
jgi:dTDP-4-amino-4,6-dideoxygalactose transaminase